MKYLGLFLTGIKLLYLLSGLKSLVEKWQARRQGAEQQQAKNMAEELKAAKDAKRIEADLSRDSDDELRRVLRIDSSDSHD